MKDVSKLLLSLGGIAGAIGAVWAVTKKPAQAAEGPAARVGLRILNAAGQEVPHNSPAELIEGEPYTFEVSVTNTSTIGGVPAAADLDISASIYFPDIAAYRAVSDRATYSFLAGQTLVFSKSFTCPVGTVGGTAQAYVIVPGTFPPSEVLLNSLTEPITVVPGLLLGADLVLAVL